MYNSSSNNNNDDDDDDNIIIITITIIVIVIVIGSYVFQPIALETSGPISESAVQFLNDLGRKITSVSAEVTEAQFLFQRLSIALQRFNAILLHESFGSDVDPDL